MPDAASEDTSDTGNNNDTAEADISLGVPASNLVGDLGQPMLRAAPCLLAPLPD